MLVLNIFSMRRSGQHGIINWIAENAGTDDVGVYDDCKFRHDEIKTASHGTFERKRFKEEKRKLLICNCEDQYIKDHSKWFPEDADYTQSVILRDPYNTIASRLKAQHTTGAFGRDLDMWKAHATESLRDDIFLIKYNEWFTSQKYRNSIMENLGMHFNDKGLDVIGKGVSSFDGRKFNGRAQEMDVLNRWKTIDGFWELFDKEVEELCVKHFNFYINNKTKEVIECKK